MAVDASTLSMLRTQTARLSRLGDDIAAVSRAEEHQLDLHLLPMAPGPLVEAAVAAAEERFTEAGVGLSADVSADLPVLRVDADRIAQVLGNLLDNALRHTTAGDEVTVTAHAMPEATGVELVVRDTGEGIDAEHLPHLFERFYRVDTARDRAHGGSGIGLAIVKALVEAHGGTVTASSPGVGAGAAFTVRLPAGQRG